MASGLPAMLHEEFLTCKICYEAFRHPKILQCLHSFCAHCLEGHLKQQSEHGRQQGEQRGEQGEEVEEDQEILCPLCRQPTPVSKEQGGEKLTLLNFVMDSLR